MSISASDLVDNEEPEIEAVARTTVETSLSISDHHHKEDSISASEHDHNKNADMEVKEFNVTRPDRTIVKEEQEKKVTQSIVMRFEILFINTDLHTHTYTHTRTHTHTDIQR